MFKNYKKNNLLKKKLEQKDSQLEQKDFQLEQKNLYIKTLESTLIDFKKNRFGSKSEKTDSNQLPLYRLSSMFKRIEVNISRQIMANWMIACAKAIQPLVNLIRDQLYDQPCIHIDD